MNGNELNVAIGTYLNVFSDQKYNMYGPSLGIDVFIIFPEVCNVEEEVNLGEIEELVYRVINQCEIDHGQAYEVDILRKELLRSLSDFDVQVIVYRVSI